MNKWPEIAMGALLVLILALFVVALAEQAGDIFVKTLFQDLWIGR